MMMPLVPEGYGFPNDLPLNLEQSVGVGTQLNSTLSSLIHPSIDEPHFSEDEMDIP